METNPLGVDLPAFKYEEALGLWMANSAPD